MSVPTVKIEYEGRTVSIEVPDVIAATIRRAIERERASRPVLQWRSWVLACLECRKPCLSDALCACCTPTQTLHPHRRLLEVDDFLARAAARLAS